MDEKEQSQWLYKNKDYLRTPRVLDGYLSHKRDIYVGTLAVRALVVMVIVSTLIIIGYNIWT
jgi:hypothetical protein